MTEAVETVETAEAEAPSFPDEISQLAFAQVEALIKERNSLVGKANAAHGDRVTLTEQVTENSTDKEIVKWREKRDEAEMKLHELVKAEVDAVIADAEGSVKDLEVKIGELDDKIKPSKTYITKMYGEALAKFLPSLERVKGLSVRSGGGGGRRIRGYVADVTVDGEVTRFQNFAEAAKYLDVDTKVLQEAFFEAAGNPAKLKDAPDVVNFTATFTEVYDDSDETVEKTAEITAVRETSESTGSDDSE
jgi:hypothetical protein